MNQSRSTRRVLRYAVVVAFGAGVGACDQLTEPHPVQPPDAEHAGPGMALSRTSVSEMAVPVPPHSVGPPVGPGTVVHAAWPGAGGEREWIPLYTAGAKEVLEVVVDGKVKITTAPGLNSCATTDCLYFPAWAALLDGTSVGPMGVPLEDWHARPLSLELRFRHASGRIAFLGVPYGSDEVSAYIGRLGAGTLEVARVPFQCINGAPCFTFSGHQTVTVNVLREQAEELVLQCTAGSASARATPSSPGQITLTRGAEIRCAATGGSPSEIVSVSGWSFTGGGQTIPRTGPQRTDASWAGRMVVSGTISVTGAVGSGLPSPARMQVTVEDRPGWAGTMRYPAAEPAPQLDVAGEVDWPPMPVRDSVGYDVWEKGGFGQYTYGIDWQGHLTSIGSGPNANWWYFTDAPDWLEPRVWISQFLDPAHPFYTSQHRARSGERAPQRYRDYCSANDMRTMASEVVAHEGQVGGSRVSHHEQKIDYVTRHDPGPVMERVVFYAANPTVPLKDIVHPELDKAYLTALQADDEAVVHAASNLFTPSCKLRY